MQDLSKTMLSLAVICINVVTPTVARVYDNVSIKSLLSSDMLRQTLNLSGDCLICMISPKPKEPKEGG